MIPLPPANAISRPYRGLSVQETDLRLDDERAVLEFLRGREVYRRTAWLLLRNGEQTALVVVRKASEEPLFSPVVEARVLASGHRMRWIESPATDVGNASALAAAVEPHLTEGVDAYAVLGRFEHVNVIWRPEPVRVMVTEVVPPEPPKLLSMAEQAVAFDEDLPPVRLVGDLVDIRQLTRDNPAESYLLPCRGAGADVAGEVAFLDTRPATREAWLMVGCERSLQFHRHFYGDEPPRVELCPRLRTQLTESESPVLTKCCLLERGVELHGSVAVVPWGANLDEVRLAIRSLVGLGPVQVADQVGSALVP